MGQEKCNLNWKTFSDHLREMLHEMMKSNYLTDVTLVCDDKRQYKAHKVVLSACSSVFQSIIVGLPLNNSVIYLRGIQHQEMESILEFMYLGEATFHEERTGEFLNVAKILEIKEISKELENEEQINIANVEQVMNDIENIAESDHSQNTSLENKESFTPIVRQSVIMDLQGQKNIDEKLNCDKVRIQSSKKSKKYSYSCDQCEYQGSSLSRHIQSEHKGVRYACDQCEYQTKHGNSLKYHIQSQHEGVRFPCTSCEYQANSQGNLKLHIMSQHEGVKYDCNQCEYKSSSKTHLKLHIRSLHEGNGPTCETCGRQFIEKKSLRIHIESKHEGKRATCDTCGHQCYTEQGLKTHIRFKHAEI